MSKISRLLLEKEILLESGTNELEILVFDVGDYVFGVNVAKVREVLPAPAITYLPNAHPSIRGVFKLRNQVVPCVSLADFLGVLRYEGEGETTAILTDLNQQETAFLVDRVEKIHRLSWEDVLAVPGWRDLSQTPVTALARCEDRLILMLDFEMILDEVTSQYFRTAAVDNPEQLPRQEATIVLVEDSPTVREAIQQTLLASGYCQLVVFENGKQAWEWLEQRIRERQTDACPARQNLPCDLVIADIEMPQVDGLHLTKRIKTHPQLHDIPVLLYSSIITPENRRKGEAVGADAQVAKPDLCHVVEYADQLIFKSGSTETQDVSDSFPSDSTPSCFPAAGHNEKEWGKLKQAEMPFDESAPNMAQVVRQEKEPQTETEEIPEEGQSSVVRDVVTNTPADAFRETTPFDQPASSPNETVAGENLSEIAGGAGQSGTQQDQPTPDDDDFEITNCVEPPEEVDPHLWQTFLHELRHRSQFLRKLVAELQRHGKPELSCNFDIVVDLARTLHTIKSAAMVVPVDAVVRVTHSLESLLETAARSEMAWDVTVLVRYCDWLNLFLNSAGLSWHDLKEIGENLLHDLQQMIPAELLGTNVQQ
jgi:two-component system chemotaxis response regulator CheV